jgi:hypothetical protein
VNVLPARVAYQTFFCGNPGCVGVFTSDVDRIGYESGNDSVLQRTLRCVVSRRLIAAPCHF